VKNKLHSQYTKSTHTLIEKIDNNIDGKKSLFQYNCSKLIVKP
jgi:hypothetical protein